MKKITLLIALMISSLGFAQQVLIENFETPATFTIAAFEGLGSAAIVADPAAGGTRGNGFQLNSVSTGRPWQGAEVVFQTSKIRLTTDKTVKVDVYSTQAFTLFSKAEMGTGPTSGAAAAYTTPGAWQTLTLSYTVPLDNQGIANGDYQKMSFFPNWKADNTGFIDPPGNFTIYVDNITAVKAVAGVDLTPTTAAPAPPARAAGNVISLFSDAYTNIAVTEWSATWDSANISDINVAGNPTKKITYGDFLGVILGAYNDATAMTHFHMDYYLEAGTDLIGKVLNPKLSNHAAQAGETNALLLTNLPTVAGSWVSLDVPLASFTPQGAGPAFAREAIKEFILSSNISTVYVDNIYLHNNTVLGTASFAKSNIKMYPNPVKNYLNIEADASINKVSVYNILGQEVLKVSPKSNSATLQTGDLQKGVYMITTDIDGNISTSKFVKE